MRYQVYKKDIYHYRVWDTVEEKFVSPEQGFRYLTLHNCEFKVNIEKYREAEKSNFQNSGDDRDFFACIECDHFETSVKFLPDMRVKFNPFVSSMFWYEIQGIKHSVKKAQLVCITGNELYMHKWEHTGVICGIY